MEASTSAFNFVRSSFAEMPDPLNAFPFRRMSIDEFHDNRSIFIGLKFALPVGYVYVSWLNMDAQVSVYKCDDFVCHRYRGLTVMVFRNTSYS
ncbi:hypothetical protein DPMN_026297 [Dreissena polymorpha]|uniref:Uncharacterized protein n=1 Tax=Dreissena polymorpha TaxID=45954 RepID=A0A9D4LT61_DREPO|nr:hypothetical protein DPMN_026297 [Dreissena polymorpha]